jgi:uncharacterized protein YkwD
VRLRRALLIGGSTIGLLGLLLGVQPGSAGDVQARVGDALPVGVMRIARPLISWTVVALDGAEVTSTSLTLDGRRVEAFYEPTTGVIGYRPTAPLPAGEHRVEARAVLNGVFPTERAWSFTVAPGAFADVPPMPASMVSLTQQVNIIRQARGLPRLRPDDRLALAAWFHAAWLERNGRRGHTEDPGTPGFTGTTPGARSASFSGPAQVDEALTYGDPEQALSKLFHAPFHRRTFLTPGDGSVAAAAVGTTTAVVVGPRFTPGVVVSPFDGEKGVPTSWGDPETPDPLARHPELMRPVGYIITWYAWQQPPRQVVVSSATLTDSSGRAVPSAVSTPKTEPPLVDGCFIIPRKPLLPGTRYTAEVKAASGDGADLSRKWSFTTAGLAPKAKHGTFKPSPAALRWPRSKHTPG